MKKRMFLLIAVGMMAMTAAAQMQRTVAQKKQVVNLESVKFSEATSMRPDTVMPNGDWQRVVQSEMTAKESFKYARQVLARIVPDYQRNVQLEDTADCKIVVLATLPLLAQLKAPQTTYKFNGTYDVTLTLTMKDNRYRVSGEAVKCSFTVKSDGYEVDRKTDRLMSEVSGMSDGTMQDDLRWKAGQLVTLIDRMLKKQKSDDDF